MTFAPENIVGAVEVWVADDIAISDGTAVSSWVGRVAASSLAQASAGQKPLYRTSSINSQPAVDFDGTDDLLRYAGTLSTAASGHVFVVMEADVVGARDFWSSSDEGSTVNYLAADANSAGVPIDMVVNDNSGTENYFHGTALTTATPYFLEWASTGTAYGLRINGTARALTFATGANNGKWFSAVSGRDNFVLGALKQSSEIRFHNGRIATAIVVDGVMSAGDRTSLNAWVTAKYGITLAADAATYLDRGFPRGVTRGVAN